MVASPSNTKGERTKIVCKQFNTKTKKGVLYKLADPNVYQPYHHPIPLMRCGCWFWLAEQ